MEYLAIIQKDSDSDYGVVFPDFLGCITAGSTIEEAIEMAREALELHIEGMLDDGEILPNPMSKIEALNRIDSSSSIKQVVLIKAVVPVI